MNYFFGIGSIFSLILMRAHLNMYPRAKSFVSHSFFGAFTMASIFVMFLGLLSLFEYIKSLYRNEAIMRRLADIQARMAQNNGGEANNANVNQAEDNLEQELIEEAAAAEEQDGNQEEAMGFDELRKNIISLSTY